MEKTRDLFNKIEDTKGKFHAKMGTIKDRNGEDLTEETRLRRGGKNKHKNYTENVLMTQITAMVFSLTYSQISQCEVKGALGSITTNRDSGGDGISVELFQILKGDAV